MHITKLGHSCLLIQEGEARILIDPGVWSEDVSGITNLDALFISHEHPDHTDSERVAVLLLNNPNLKIFTNPGVGQVLTAANIPWTTFVHGEVQNVNDLSIEAVGEKHAEIYPNFPIVHNTGFLIDDRFFYPGDSFVIPDKPVEILALPVCAPWLKMADALDYAKKINPKICFPVHDGMLKHAGPFHKLPRMVLGEENIKVLIPEIGISFSVN